jgi:DNA-binding Lrp family transcriptional regulator
MLEAFILINAELGKEDSLLKEIRNIPNVKEAYVVYGGYDIIVKAEAENMDKLRDIVTFNIRRLKEVRSTITITVIEGI